MITGCDSDSVDGVIWVDACTTGRSGAWLPIASLCGLQCDLEGLCQFWEFIIQHQQVQNLTERKKVH